MSPNSPMIHDRSVCFADEGTHPSSLPVTPPVITQLLIIETLAYARLSRINLARPLEFALTINAFRWKSRLSFVHLNPKIKLAGSAIACIALPLVQIARLSEDTKEI